MSRCVAITFGLVLASTLAGIGSRANAQAELAVVSVKAPKKVTLKSTTPGATRKLKARIQNVGVAAASIADLTSLESLVNLEIESLEPMLCPEPLATLMSPNTGFPLLLAPNKKLSLVFEVTFDCANDPLRTTKTDFHSDFGYSLMLDPQLLDVSQDDPSNNVCPRDPTEYDEGCGARTELGLLGGEILTDLLELQTEEPGACIPSAACCAYCSTGKACGNSCISRSYTCHQPPGCACNASEVCP